MLFSLSACGEKPEEYSDPVLEAEQSSATADVSIPVSSDPSAKYALISWEALPNGNRQAVTRRNGTSGESFARREIDCSGSTFRYLGEGDTLADALRDGANIGDMAALTPGSISTEVSTFVCSL